MPTQEQLFLSCLITSIVVALVTIPFFGRLIGINNDYKQGKIDSVSTGIFWTAAIHLIIVVVLIMVIKMWDLLIGDSMPEFTLQGSGGLFDIFWSECNDFTNDSEIINSLNAYRCIFFTYFEFILSLLIGLSPILFFMLAFFATSPNDRESQVNKNNDIFSRIFKAGLWTFVLMVFLLMYLETMNEVIFYKGGASSIFEMSQNYWTQLLTF